MRRLLFLGILFGSAFAAISAPVEEGSPGLTTATASTTLADPAAATKAWLETVPPNEKARSDAYFEGGYWLILWNFLLSVAISILFLGSRISAQLRDSSERLTKRRWLQPAIYAVPYILLVFLLSFPLDLYTQFFREHAYGLANQSFGPWFGEQLTKLAIGMVTTALGFSMLYAVFRRAPQAWWIWGTAVGVVFIILGNMIFPVLVAPLFNKYRPLSDPKISQQILAMAQANEIPVRQVFEVDASRQSKRVSANVSGLFGTARIALNDNLLKQCSLPEIRAVMAHEMGHYVLNHSFKLILYQSLLLFGGFVFSSFFFAYALERWGQRWGVRGVADPAGFPLLALLFSIYVFLITPLSNSTVRITEREADQFGINTSREADGFAKVALKIGRYRKLDPGPLEEIIFFDHPSGRARIRMAMDWKAANLPAGDVPGPIPSR
jgi:STE24 endopeptidase